MNGTRESSVEDPTSDGGDLIARAVQEERTEPELTDQCHEGPAAEAIGRSLNALSAARRLAASRDPLERAVAAHVLGSLVDGNTANVDGATALLDGMIQDAIHPHLEWSIADALRLTCHPSAVEPLSKLAASKSSSVRRTVAMGLAGAIAADGDSRGVEQLVRLSADPDPTVRDWATFGLSQLDDDSEQIRSALWDRVDDPHYNIRSEALAALAARHERALVDRVRAELQTDYVGKLVVLAAAELADSALLEPLRSLRDWWDIDPELLERAIAASQPTVTST